MFVGPFASFPFCSFDIIISSLSWPFLTCPCIYFLLFLSVVVASSSTHANVRSLLNEAEAGAISPHISRIKDIKDPFQLRQSLMTMEIFTDRSTWEAAVGPPSWEAAFPSEGTHSSLAIECGGTAAAHEVFTLEQSTTFFFITPAVVVLKPVVNEVTASMNFTKPVTAWCGDFDLGRGGLGQGLDLNIDLVWYVRFMVSCTDLRRCFVLLRKQSLSIFSPTDNTLDFARNCVRSQPRWYSCPASAYRDWSGILRHQSRRQLRSYRTNRLRGKQRSWWKC